LGPRLDDIDLNLDEFVKKVNADLVGNVVNLASRTARFVQGQTLCDSYPDDGGLFAHAAKRGEAIADAYERCDYNAAIREILQLSDRANKFVEDNAPWNLAKDPAKQDELRRVCTIALNLFRQIAIYLAPVLPRLAERTGRLLNAPIEQWDQSQQPLIGTRVEKFEHMMRRMDRKQVETMIEESKTPEELPTAEAGATDGPEALQQEPLTEQFCSFDDFMKIDMRVARVVEAEDVKESKKLLRLKLSLGGDVTRTVLAGIKEVYKPEELVGRLVICCANLEPRKMRFGVSEGMVLAAGPGGQDIYLLRPDDGAVPGQRVH